MNDDILDDLIEKPEKPASPNVILSIGFAVMILIGYAMTIMHWKYGNLLLISGVILSLGYQLGYMWLLQFNNQINNFFFAVNITLLILIRKFHWPFVRDLWYLYIAGIVFVMFVVHLYHSNRKTLE